MASNIQKELDLPDDCKILTKGGETDVKQLLGPDELDVLGKRYLVFVNCLIYIVT